MSADLLLESAQLIFLLADRSLHGLELSFKLLILAL